MALLPRESPAPEPACFRCSKPIAPGTAAQRYGRPVHMRCLSEETRLDSIEQQDTARRLVECARAAVSLAAKRVNMARRLTHCPACGEPFTLRRSVLFQGDQLVHAGCWRADPPPA
jgi:hypothetical protein